MPFSENRRMKTIAKCLINQNKVLESSERILEIFKLSAKEQIDYFSKLDWTKEEIFIFSNLAIDYGFEIKSIDLPFHFEIHEDELLSQSIRKRHRIFGKSFIKDNFVILFYAKEQDLRAGRYHFWFGKNFDKAISFLEKGVYPLDIHFKFDS